MDCIKLLSFQAVSWAKSAHLLDVWTSPSPAMRPRSREWAAPWSSGPCRWSAHDGHWTISCGTWNGDPHRHRCSHQGHLHLGRLLRSRHLHPMVLVDLDSHFQPFPPVRCPNAGRNIWNAMSSSHHVMFATKDAVSFYHSFVGWMFSGVPPPPRPHPKIRPTQKRAAPSRHSAHGFFLRTAKSHAAMMSHG